MSARPSTRATLLVVAALTLLALALRAPARHEIPRYTDETAEVAAAIAIARDGARPLVHDDAYRGAFWAYLLAGALWLGGGADPDLPRDFALALGVLTVLATYGLARAMAGPTAGLIAGILMATAFGPIALLSHVAWSNHSTPLWTTLAALCLWKGAGAKADPAPPGEDRRAGVWLALSGLLWGLALQTHPSVLALLPGAVLWFLAAGDRRARLRGPGPWLALVFFVLAISPLLVYNLRSGMAGVTEGSRAGQPIEREPGAAAWARNLGGLAGQLGRTAAAGPAPEPFMEFYPMSRLGDLVLATDALRPLATFAYALLLLGALGWSAWRGPRLPAWLAGSALVVLPLVNRNYTSFHDMRYIGFLLPLGYAAFGAGVAAWIGAPGTRGRRVAAGLAVAGLALYPLAATAAFYHRETIEGRTNRPYRAAVAYLERAAAGPGHHIFVDKAMRPIKMGGGGDPTRSFAQLLTLRGIPHTVTDLEELRWYFEQDRASTFWIFAADETAEDLHARGVRPVVEPDGAGGGTEASWAVGMADGTRRTGWQLVVREGGR